MLSVSYPQDNRNYCVFNPVQVNKIISRKNNLEEIDNTLKISKDKDEILLNLYALNVMLDNGASTDSVKELYPELSKFNNTNSPEIQVFLAGIYRKTKIPDAFGPLCAMLIRNSVNPPSDINFDPNEEIGGAILDYLA